MKRDFHSFQARGFLQGCSHSILKEKENILCRVKYGEPLKQYPPEFLMDMELSPDEVSAFTDLIHRISNIIHIPHQSLDILMHRWVNS